MISYHQDNKKFNYRIAGLAIHNGKVLVHQFEGFDFWSLPGGRAEMGEDSIESILREFQEELGEEIKVDRLLWCCESFYDHRGFNVHELCFYYLVEFLKDSEVVKKKHEFEVVEIDGSLLNFKWMPIEDVKKVEFYPTFIKDRLETLPKHTEHMIDREEQV